MWEFFIRGLLIFGTYLFLFFGVTSITDNKKKINIIDILVILIVSTLNTAANISNNSLLKGIITYIGFTAFAFNRSKSIKESSITGFVFYVFAIISDILSAIFISSIGYNDFVVNVSNVATSKLIYCFILAIIMLLIINIKKIRLFSVNVKKYLSNIRHIVKLLILVFALFEIGIIISLTHTSSFRENLLSFLLMFSLAVAVYMLIYNVTKKDELEMINQNLKLNNESFMKMLNNYKMFKHNMKHELALISSVGNKKIKDLVKSYIDEYDDHFEFDDSDIVKLPEGIKAIVYQKILESHIINFSVVVDNFIDFDPYDFLSIKKICKLNQCIGIILDNAIEEAVLTKEKYIYIKLILDDNNKVTFECQIL